MKKGLVLSLVLLVIPAALFLYALDIQREINIWPWDSFSKVFLKVLFGEMSRSFLMYAVFVSMGGVVYLWYKGVREVIIERLCYVVLIGAIIFTVTMNLYNLKI